MERILDRYVHHSSAERELLAYSDPEVQGIWSTEYTHLKNKTATLQKYQKQLMGEELELLSMEELQQLEHGLEQGLKQIWSKKNHLLFNSILELQKKEMMLEEQNRVLEQKLKKKMDFLTSIPSSGPLKSQGNNSDVPPIYEAHPALALNIA